eukprot:comp12114_c0_seq1/m.6850 comp12114_c0_seq1/g.6850  ORF comp12114_c0_seq1/g.6850 comp12114_c0_seq1/m.6850 type:complete len:180 (-) comp12114_c0_seq1:232-771(-)
MYASTKQVASLARKAVARTAVRGVHVEAKIAAMGHKLAPATPKANYVNIVCSGSLCYLSGHLPYDKEGKLIVGKVPTDISEDQGYQAARATMLSLLGTLKAEIGDLDRVQRVIKVTGMVNSTPDFTNHPKVINGASDLLNELYGTRGQHARVAAGFGSLPLGVPVEIDMIVEVEANHLM